MRLADFIEANTEAILAEWEEFARTHVPAGEAMDVAGLRDHAADILKAVAMGADVVALGRLQAWGLAAYGTEGVVRMLEILEDEMVCAMGLCGLTSLEKLTPKYICPAEPVTDAHEMSAWVNMPTPRIL